MAEFTGQGGLRCELEGAAEQAVVAAPEKADQVTSFGRQRVLATSFGNEALGNPFLVVCVVFEFLKDAAAELGISYGTLHALMKDGGIEFTQVGSGKYISRASLAAFIETNTHR